MRGLLAAASAVSVAALTFTTSQPYALVANVLTVTGYTAGGTLQWDMSKAFQGHYCDADSGNTCTPVRYLSGLPLVGESDGLRALRSAIKTSQGPTVVLGYSQGALIAADWLEENENEDAADRPDPENLSFVLFGNSLRKYGGVRPAYDIDPPMPDSDYHVTDIAIEYDGAADFPDDPFNLLALANAFAGFQYVHIYGYDDVDLENDEKLVWTDGNVTYVLIRQQNIPLLEPLRRLGLHELADELNGPLKEIIDSAYHRDYPGLVSSTSEDIAAQYVSQDIADQAATVDAASSRPQRSRENAEDAEDAEDATQHDLTALTEDRDETLPDTGDSDDSATEDESEDAPREIPDTVSPQEVPDDDSADNDTADADEAADDRDAGSDSDAAE